MYIDVPAKVIQGYVQSIFGAALWPYNSGGNDIYWSGGSQPRYYRWQLTISVSEQSHSSNKTRKPYGYNGHDVAVGDYVADKIQGIAVKIIGISSKTDDEIVCTVEDVLRYNTFRDSSKTALGIFSNNVDILIFQLNEEGQPIVDPAPLSGLGTNFFTNLYSRFTNMEQNYNFILDKPSHGFALGELVSADPDNDTFVLADSGHPFIVGTVSNVDLGPDSFMINPFQKIVDGYPKLVGQVGSIIYAGSTPGEFSLVGTQPVMIKLRQESNCIVTGSTLADNAAVDPDSAFNLNSIPIVVGNVGSPEDMAASMNMVSADTGVSAEVVQEPPIAKTQMDLLNNFSLVFIQVPAQGIINGVTVDFVTSTSGDVSLGAGFADHYDMAQDINAASIPNIVASATSSELVLTSSSGPIILGNIGVDGMGNPFAGPMSSTGLPLSTTAGARYIVLTGDGAVPISLYDTHNTPTHDFGLYSAENGTKAAALYIEQGVRTAKTYVVTDISSRDALDATVGDQAYVQDVGNGEWAFYIYTLDSEWVQLSNKDSSETDAQSVDVAISSAAATSGTIHTISNGRRVSFVTVTVVDPFDAPATIMVGDDSDNDRLMTVDQNDLTSVGDYSTTPSYTYSPGADTTIKYYFNAAGATQGNAIVAITYT